ncbi:hypothetical protein KY285_036289 [Solanum tuberosum]|nr:hypothetical protein KY285_036289 [Solanum tuberosum]
MKASIFSTKGPAMVHIAGSVTGFLIHRNLLLTTHAILPSVAVAEAAEIRLQNGVAACLFPHRFFITSSVLDLTIVGLDVMDGDTNAHLQQPHYLKTCSKPNLELGNVIYLLGYSEEKELTVGEGKVIIATDNLIKLSTDGISWRPGSAGFDAHGNLAFMVCDPMKLATSPNSKSSTTSASSSSSRKKECPMQFGIPIPIICDWLNQHWEGNLDDLNKPKLPIIRLMSAGQKSDHSCASFTMRRVFKSTEAENGGTPSPSNRLSKPREQSDPSCSAVATNMEEEALTTDPHAVTHVHGIPTPEIYESPNLTSIPVRMKEGTHIQLLDINFPPRIAKFSGSPQPARRIRSSFGENFVNKPPLEHPSEVQSSSSPIRILEMENGYSSDGEITMYSAETAESRNFPSPREGRLQQVGRSQSCVNYNRWGTAQQNAGARRAMLQQQQRSSMQGRKVYSQGANSQRSNDYFNPTVSSIMKKRNNMEPQTRPRQSAVNSSPKWNF